MLIAYDQAGSDDPVVLLVHAGVADRRMWQPQWDALADRFRVIRCDLRGFGETPLPSEQYSNADDVAALLDQLGIEQVAIVGSSFGGRVALEAASAQPSRVSRLVLLSPAYNGIEPTPTAVAFGEREDALLEAGKVDGYVELNVETWLGPDADDSAKDLVRDMQRHAVDVQLAAESGPTQPELTRVDVAPKRIECPAVIVSGKRDIDHFQAIATHLAATMPNARLLELDWAGHLPSLERPIETTALIIEALTSDD